MKKEYEKTFKTLLTVFLGLSTLVGCSPKTEKNETVQEVGYEVISKDVPQFDEVPIAAYDQGYVVKVDNHYGFIDPEGIYKIDPDYEVITRGINEYINDGYFYCGFETLKDSPSLDGGTNFGYLLDVDGVDNESCGNSGFGGTTSFIYTYDGKSVQIEKTSEYADLSDVDKTPKRTVAINASNYTMFEEYYIYVPETNEGFGPYKNEEVPNFDLEGKGLTEHKQVGDFQTINLGFIHAQPVVQGIFWDHEDGQYRIVSEHGEKSEDLYDEAKVISNDSILVKKGDQWGIVDESLEFIDLKDTSIEEMSKPIDGNCFIKKDGKWTLVEIKGSKKEKKEEQQEEAQTISYVVLDDVVNGVYLHTEPDKEDKSNRRGLLMPKETVEIVDIIENEDCVWGKTKDNQYVCIYETATDEDKPVGEYMKPTDQVQSSSNIDTSSYSSLIEDYRMALDHKDVSYLQKYGIHSLEGYPSLENTIEFPHSSAWFHGYLIKDINGDGIEEFIVGYNPKARLAGMYFNSFEALYTMKDGNIVYLCGRDDLNGSEFHILYDGTLYKYKPSTTPTVDVEHYKIQEDSMVLLDSFQGEAGALRGDYYDDSVDNGWVDNLTLFENN